ncbi:MAG TPA: hypothetical protein VJL33_00445 [Candidatus Bathyarchaeia archaeon]|nr:hypothetical protein [Candidatus Bathyarchaeia archaeon]
MIGEFVLLGGSILVFRSVWMLLDQYFGNSSLWLLLIVGIVLAIMGLLLMNREVKCEIKELKKTAQFIT